MDYIGNKEYWEEKFSSRGNTPLLPEPSLAENVKHFKKGSVLDIACGDGRNALFLLEKGFAVTGIDYSETALKRFAAEKNYRVNTKQVDLYLPNALKEVGIFDNIVVNHFRLKKERLAELINHLSDDGILFVCGFGHKHPVDLKIKKEDLIQPTDFEALNPVFRLVQYQEHQDDRGFFVTYLFRKNKVR
jgi:2-polyprenyl-3-methyl-5-hydroxy-6-metoxy-1,4-benzoquinol methylase